MKNITFLTIILIILLSCEKKSSNLIEIETYKIHDYSLILKKLKPFSFINSIPSNLKGIIELDTISIQYLSFFRKKGLKKLEDEKLDVKNNNDHFVTGVYALSGYLNNKQILIVDANNNLDFSDDRKFIFKKKLRDSVTKNSKIRRDSFPLIVINYNSIENRNIIEKSISIRPYPHLDYLTYKNPTDRQKLNNELQIVAEISNYNYGEFNVENEVYKVAFTKNLSRYTFLFTLKNREFLNRSHKDYKSYRLKDIINLSNKFYRLDSLNFNESKLFLMKLDITQKIEGYHIGEIINDFTIKDLDDYEININQFAKKKKYTLIDFWGTWCAPCIELTPDLVRMNSNYSTELNLLSIAVQKDKKSLLEYIDKKNMTWKNGFIKANAKSKSLKSDVITNLRIESYPTFILIDQNRRIVHRGSGRPALEEIEKIISRNSKAKK